MATLEYDPEINVFIRELLLMVFYLNACTCLIVYPFGHELSGVLTFEITKERFNTGIWILISLCILIVLCMTMAISKCVQSSACKITYLVLAFIFMNTFGVGVNDMTSPMNSSVVSHVYMANCFVLILYYLLSFNYFDFTSWKIYIWLSVILFIPFYIGLTIIMNNKILFMIGTIYSTFMMTLDIQLILGGRAIEIDDEDYALGAFCVYLSGIDVYFKLLQRIGLIKGTSDD